MNYLVVSEEFFGDHPGGAARVALDIARVMRDRGYSVSILCKAHQQHPGDARFEQSMFEGMRVVRCYAPLMSKWNPFRAKTQINLVALAAKTLLSDQFWDVVHVHTPLVGAGALKGLGRIGRLVYTMHSPVVAEQEIIWRTEGTLGLCKRLFAGRMLGEIERSVLRKCNTVHVLSQFTRSELMSEHGSIAPVSVIPHWCRPELRRTVSSMEARKRLHWPGDSPIVLTVRGLKPRNGLETAIDAIGPLAAAGECRFMIAGDGPLLPVLREQARRLGALPDRLSLMGSISEDELLLAYQAADLFILPTAALECFGLITQEAMAMGCPVLGTRVGAIPEMIEPISSNLLVEPGDAMAMQNKVRGILTRIEATPSADSLMEYMDQHYSERMLIPQIVELLTGSRSI